MPLLKRKAFEKSSASEFLRDEEEVFHCEITDEIFRDYEEYCERIILVNSLVWSCEMTGKPNLTYAEALESERNARKSLRDFPMELRVPILYLASKTKRCTFAEMLDDVFNFVRDKYFVGETVEACFDEETWCEGQILSVTTHEAQKNADGSPGKASSMYSYEVEQFDEQELDDTGLGKVTVLSHDKVRRSRGVFTRDKNKLYLKQFVEQGPGGIIRIKENTIEKYNIGKVKFNQIFNGDPPEFPSSKKLDRLSGNATIKYMINGKKNQDKKTKQESMAKYVTKVDKFEGTKQSKSMETNKEKLNKLDSKSGKVQKAKNGVVEAKNLKEEMKRLGEEMKQKKLEEKMKKKEKSQKLAALLKEWNKQKDDLELDDHKQLPTTIPVDIPDLPNKYFGDFVAILEFFHEFAKPLKVKETFHHGVDMEVLRRALTTKEVAGPLSDIIQMLLGAIFTLQEDEAEEYNEDRSLQKLSDNKEHSEDIGVTAMRGIQLATNASKWPQTYLATPLSQLPLDSQTFSEVLRLHLLSSGSSGGDQAAKWRYQQRGGYSSQDDPGLWLRIQCPHVIRALSKKHFTELSIGYKLKIINCLINQILSYATIRDIVEEKIEKSKNLKNDVKALQIAERKREAELIVNRQKLRKDATVKKEEEKLTGEAAVALDKEVKEKLEALTKESELKKAEYEKKLKNMQLKCFTFQSYLGMDRAHRRYWLYETVPGLFVEHDVRFNTVCLENVVLPNPALALAPAEDALSYVQKMFESELAGSDKENDSDNKKHIPDSPKKSTESNVNLVQDLLMCTANPATCTVHSKNSSKTRWSFLHLPEQVDLLIGALNKRGIRESELKQYLEQDKEFIINYMRQCPVVQLNPVYEPPLARIEMQTRLTRRYVDANLRFPPGTRISEVLEMSLRDSIVDLEEKLFMGCLGELQVKDRLTWRETILKREYDKQCHTLSWGASRSLTEDLQIINGKSKMDAVYKDPGFFLGGTVTTSDAFSDEENNEDQKEDSETVDDIKVVRDLASALLQIGQAITTKYLKRPLGYDEKERAKDPKATFDFKAQHRWETSLMECTSFAQVMLHLIILDNSVLWSKSILNANCRICRRKTDAENMLLCDSCNKGHHMYCLKPKLTKVPEGDWFCDQCKPKEKTPQKRTRRVFKEVEEEENEQEDEEEEDEEEDESESDESNSWDGSVSVALCTKCGSGGVLMQCTQCSDSYHSECLVKPPHRRAAFICPNCTKSKHRDSHRNVRRCAADALNNVNHYAKMLKKSPKLVSSDSDSMEEIAQTKAKIKRKRQSKESSPVVEKVNGASKKPRKSAPIQNSDSNDEYSKPQRKRASKEPTNGITNGASKRNGSLNMFDEYAPPKRASAPISNSLFKSSSNRKSRRSEAFHRDGVEELLNDIMKHKDSWPFNSPVTLEEVPDYFEIIRVPMDFGTIKQKLQGNKYADDTSFVNECGLVFSNCEAYNQEDDSVYKAGMRLKKYFNKRCGELNIVSLTNPDSASETTSGRKNRSIN